MIMRALIAAVYSTVTVASSASVSDAANEFLQRVAAQQVPTTQQAPRQQNETPVQQISAKPALRVWTTTFSTETRYFSWHNNFVPAADGSGTPGKGWQVYVPFAVQLTGKPIDTLSLDFTARGGWVKSVQSTSGHSGEVQTITDTVMSGTATYQGMQGMQPFVSINLNLPTGKAALFGDAANARMDPDLVDISTFGEGYNVGPTAGFNFPITSSLLLTTSVGYTWRGHFNQESTSDPSQPFLTSSVDPGDNVTATAAVNYQTGPFSAGLTGTATWETATSVDGTQTLKPGLRYLLALQSGFTWPEKFGTTSLSASVAHSNRNKVLLPGVDGLVIEALNSNSNVYRVGLQHMFPIGDLQVGPTGSVLYRDHNGYNSATLQFVPQKTRWSAGLLAQYAPTPTVTLNARIEGVWTHENENPAADGLKFDDLVGDILFAATVPPISGTAWQTSIGINIRM